MSDVGRKSFVDKAKEAIKPDSEKDTLEQVQEKGTDYLDKFGKEAQPEDDKSTFQKGADKASTEKQSAKGKVAEAADHVSESFK